MPHMIVNSKLCHLLAVHVTSCGFSTYPDELTLLGGSRFRFQQTPMLHFVIEPSAEPFTLPKRSTGVLLHYQKINKMFYSLLARFASDWLGYDVDPVTVDLNDGFEWRWTMTKSGQLGVAQDYQVKIGMVGSEICPAENGAIVEIARELMQELVYKKECEWAVGKKRKRKVSTNSLDG